MSSYLGILGISAGMGVLGGVAMTAKIHREEMDLTSWQKFKSTAFTSLKSFVGSAFIGCGARFTFDAITKGFGAALSLAKPIGPSAVLDSVSNYFANASASTIAVDTLKSTAFVVLPSAFCAAGVGLGIIGFIAVMPLFPNVFTIFESDPDVPIARYR